MERRTTRNPVLKPSRWGDFGGSIEGRAMTVRGAYLKTTILFFIMMAASFFGMSHAKDFSLKTLLILLIFSLITVIFACIFTKLSPLLAPIYAILEGYLLGTLSAYSHYVLEAFILTSVIFFTLLILYQVRIIRISRGFVKTIWGLTIGIALFYLIEFILIAFGVTTGNIVFGNGIVGLLIGLFCLFVAVSNLLVDFFMIEEGADAHLPKYMEWYFGMSLLISIVWVYTELLDLLERFK